MDIDYEDADVSMFEVKIPPFWSNNPESWCNTIEAQFSIKGIKSDYQKYHDLVAALSKWTISFVRDIVINPPETDKFGTLRSRLIERFKDIQEKELRVLFSKVFLGEDKPSQLLQKMGQLVNNQLSEDMLSSFWIQKLPFSVQAFISVPGMSLENKIKMADKILEIQREDRVKALSEITLGEDQPSPLLQKIRRIALTQMSEELWLQRLPANLTAILSCADGDLDKMAEIADRILKVPVGNCNCHTVTQQNQDTVTGSQTPRQLQRMQDQISTLTSQMGMLLKQNTRERSRSRYSSQGRTRSKNHHKHNEQGICWPHAKFKKKAYKCFPPCNFNKIRKNNHEIRFSGSDMCL